MSKKRIRELIKEAFEAGVSYGDSYECSGCERETCAICGGLDSRDKALAPILAKVN